MELLAPIRPPVLELVGSDPTKPHPEYTTGFVRTVTAFRIGGIGKLPTTAMYWRFRLTGNDPSITHSGKGREHPIDSNTQYPSIIQRTGATSRHWPLKQ